MLGGVKDEATANAAVPGLQDIAKQIDSVKAAALFGDAKKSIASLVAAALPGITAAVEKAVGFQASLQSSIPFCSRSSRTSTICRKRDGT